MFLNEIYVTLHLSHCFFREVDLPAVCSSPMMPVLEKVNMSSVQKAEWVVARLYCGTSRSECRLRFR